MVQFVRCKRYVGGEAGPATILLNVAGIAYLLDECDPGPGIVLTVNGDRLSIERDDFNSLAERLQAASQL